MSEQEPDYFTSIIIEAHLHSTVAVSEALRRRRRSWLGAIFPCFNTPTDRYHFLINNALAYRLVAAAAAAKCEHIRRVLDALKKCITYARDHRSYTIDTYAMVKQMLVKVYGRCDYDLTTLDPELFPIDDPFVVTIQ